MSKDNQRIIANAKIALKNRKINREQYEDVRRLVIQNETEAKMLKKYDVKSTSHDGLK